MVILRKLALRVQADLGAHSSKIKNAASPLEAPFEPFNFHWDMCVLHRDPSSVRAPASATGGTAFNVRSPREPVLPKILKLSAPKFPKRLRRAFSSQFPHELEHNEFARVKKKEGQRDRGSGCNFEKSCRQTWRSSDRKPVSVKQRKRCVHWMLACCQFAKGNGWWEW